MSEQKENIIENIFNITKELNENFKQLDLSSCSEEDREELLNSLNEMLKTLSEISPVMDSNELITKTEEMINDNIGNFSNL
jgi:hypothetical protein